MWDQQEHNRALQKPVSGYKLFIHIYIYIYVGFEQMTAVSH